MGWKAIVESDGFRLRSDGGNFIQFTPPYGVPWTLDFMVDNEQTFSKLASSSREVVCCGINVRVPVPEHLIALRLHALVQGPAPGLEKDFPDIVRLARMTNLNPQSPEVLEVFKQYGTQKQYVRYLKTLEH